MNAKLSRDLCLIEPSLFKSTEEDIQAQEIPPFYFECGDGWFTILRDFLVHCVYLMHDPQHATDWKGLQFLQIKEKFGSLNIYPSLSIDSLNLLIEAARIRSMQTCESCGETRAPLFKRNNGWITVSCEKCKKEDDTYSQIDEVPYLLLRRYKEWLKTRDVPEHAKPELPEPPIPEEHPSSQSDDSGD